MGFVWEFAKAVYSLGLLLLGVIVITGAPRVIQVLRDLTSALAATARGLSGMGLDRETVEQLRAAVDRIERVQAEDRRVLADIRASLDDFAPRRREVPVAPGKRAG